MQLTQPRNSIDQASEIGPALTVAAICGNKANRDAHKAFWLALVLTGSIEIAELEIYVQTLPFSDKKWQVSTVGGYEPRWRPDGREIYYLSEDRKLMVVPVDLAGPSFGVPKTLFQTRVPAGVIASRMHYQP